MNTEMAVIISLGIIIAAVMICWTFYRADTILQNWANRHGYVILKQHYCWFWRGPFFWTSSKNQAIYYVTVEDRDGQLRTGYVRCGGWFWGLFVDTADVIWD